MTLWVRYLDGDRPRFGVLEGDRITPHSGDMFGDHATDGPPRDAGSATLLPPTQPRTFIGLWNNFHEIAARTNQPAPDTPLYFIKAPGSILPPGGVIRRPPAYDGRVVFEGELGVVIGKICTNLDEAAAEKAIFGYTCVNDVTAVQWIGEPDNFAQWTRAKGCDSFGPFGPAVATGLNWADLRIRSLLNGRERQNYPASDMIFPPARIVSLISRELTLVPGDIIACGTSVGALPMKGGARIEIVIDGVGALANTFEEDSAA